MFGLNLKQDTGAACFFLSSTLAGLFSHDRPRKCLNSAYYEKDLERTQMDVYDEKNRTLAEAYFCPDG
jgi:hypothetical protein